MKRRQFLAACGAATYGGILNTLPVLAENSDKENIQPRLNRDLLKVRNNNRSTVVCQNGIVCASQPLAAMAGIDILKAGGNCVDAAICTNAIYRDWNVWELPPNGQGIAALQILNILENFDLSQLKPNSSEHLHLFIEAKKLAFEDRAQYYADPEFADVPIEWLISKEYAKKRAKLIDTRIAQQKIKFGDPALGTDTVYLAAADNEGNMISFIQSNYHGYGSTIRDWDVVRGP